MAISYLFGQNAQSKPLLSVLLGFICFFSPLTFAGQYETTRAIEYYENGEYRRAKSILSSRDISRDPVALYMMGAISLKDAESNDRDKILDTAIRWFEQSADLDYPQAYHALGRSYQQRWMNQGSLDDYEKSKINYELALSNDIEIAQYDLARLVSSPAPGLDEQEKQRRNSIDNRIYSATTTDKSAEPEAVTQLVAEPAAEAEESTLEGQAAVAPDDTGSELGTRSNNWTMRPYIGLTGNFFSIGASDFTGTDTNTGASVSVSGSSRDKGSAAGLSGGVFVNENSKAGFSYFSGKENDSSIMTLTVASIHWDYSFNNFGLHRGFFLGGGAAYVEIETDATSLTSAASTNSSGLLVRGGYGHLFDSGVYLELGIDKPLFELDYKLRGRGTDSNIEIGAEMDVVNIYLSLSYLF